MKPNRIGLWMIIIGLAVTFSSMLALLILLPTGTLMYLIGVIGFGGIVLMMVGVALRNNLGNVGMY